MATELIAVGVIDANSADITVVAGTPVTLFLKTTAGTLPDSQARASVQVKTSASLYQTIGALNGVDRTIVIDGPGTYRVQKYAGPSFGVEQG